MKRFSILLILLCVAVLSFAEDIIILKSSNKIEAIIQEVSKNEIKYKKSVKRKWTYVYHFHV